jgi:hypothetical protein
VCVRDLGTRPAPVSICDLLSRAGRGRGPVVRVTRREIPYWQERGWARQGNIYTGSYQTAYTAFWGHITEHRGGRVEFLLHNPSDEIRSHSHWVCFQHRGNNWYLVHMTKQPRDVSSGILTIERLLTEAYES